MPKYRPSRSLRILKFPVEPFISRVMGKFTFVAAAFYLSVVSAFHANVRFHDAISVVKSKARSPLPLSVSKASGIRMRNAHFSLLRLQAGGDDWERDNSESGRRLSSKRLERIAENDQQEPADNKILIILGQ